MRAGGILFYVKNVLLFSLALTLFGPAFAQGAASQTADSIIAKVTAAQKGVKDLSFKVSGTANLESGPQNIDLDVRAIPAQSLARINFNAPNALADNVVVADKNTVSNYLFLTNQVIVQDAKAAGAGGVGVDFSQLSDATALLSKNFDTKLLSSSKSGAATVYVLQATPKGGGTDLSRVYITDQGWRPVRVQAVSGAGKVVSDLSITGYKTNQGLSAAKLRALPADAEVVRR